jgi:3,4-dihydroxyphenylacetate 2,3-dioxygenase
MGEIVGAALVSHVPTIVLSADERLALNDGKEISLVTGLHRLRREILDELRPDTIVVVDTHWFTTFQHILSAHDRRAGVYTSDELPNGVHGVAYDMPGDPELAKAVAEAAAGRDDTWVIACDDPHLPVHYATINLLGFLQGEEAWVSAGVCQTATADDFLLFGSLIAMAVARIDRRVVVLASGGMSHRFWPLRQLRQHESSDPANIVSDDARLADEEMLGRFLRGDHAEVLANMASFARFSPEGYFGHYLTMLGAVGGASCRAPGVQYSDYESAAGTGQVDVWFDRPAGGWTGA